MGPCALTSLLLAALLVSGCGGATPPARHAAADLIPATRAGLAERQAVVVVVPGVDDATLFGAWYALAADGWMVRLAATRDAPSPLRTAGGAELAVDLLLEDVRAEDVHVFYFPDGSDAVADAAPEGPVRAGFVPGAQFPATRAGDVSGVVWSLNTWADDALRQRAAAAKDAGGGDPP
jgi:hypothetical protein